MILSCQTYQPSEWLNNYVVRYWATTSEEYRDIFVIPDGYPELVFRLDGSFSFEFNVKSASDVNAGIFGQMTGASRFITGKGTRLLWVKLFPWVPYKLFGIPVEQFNNNIVEAAAIEDREFVKLGRRICDCGDLPEAIEMIESFLINRIYALDKTNGIVQSAAKKIFQLKGDISIGSLLSLQGGSSRHLQKLFKKEMGLSPSYYRKLIRIKAISLELLSDKSIHLTHLAYDRGYTDHSHLIKDFKSVAGLSPLQFRKLILGNDITLLDTEMNNEMDER